MTDTAIDTTVDTVVDTPSEPVADATIAESPATSSPATALNTEPSAEPSSPEPAGMPDNWRALMAGEDDKTLKQLDRYSTPADMAKALIEAKQKIREGLATGLPDDPTDDQVAAYREKNGIPAEASGYEIKLEDGLVIGDEDKPVLDHVLQAMHGANATPDQVNAMTNAYFAMQEQAYQDQQVVDTQQSQEATNELKDVWGTDFIGNTNAVKSLLNTLPESVKEQFEGARLADGRAVFNSPEVMQWMADTARQANPAATIMPNVANPVQAMGDEIKSIEKVMRENPNEYWRDNDMQARLRELMDAQDGMSKR